MDPGTAIERIRVDVLPGPRREHVLAEIRRGLLARPPRTNPKYFYDDRGSALFEAICELPEYYPTRTERALLAAVAGDVARRTGAAELAELGPGSALKTRLLLDALAARGHLRLFVPFDWSAGMVRRVAQELVREYPQLHVHAVVGDFVEQLDALPRSSGPRLVAFLGGTIGNFRPDEARRFLGGVASRMAAGEHLLLGTDLVKPTARLEAAYNDSAGVTAEFNLNVLRVLNDVAGADFVPERFAHRAFFDREQSWIEMRLVSQARQDVHLLALDLRLALAPGDEILTEISAKYDRPRVEHLLAASGFDLEAWYVDPENLFALSLARRR
jgi:L-histidine N-alpha-methyltransferase